MLKTLRVGWGWIALAACIVISGPALAEDHLAFYGGPQGGTFQYFSNGMSIRLSAALPEVQISNTASAGSLENLRRIDSGEADFAIVYSGDAYLGRQGKLTRDPRQYRKVHALAFLYGAPAHLVVRADSGIAKVEDLLGKRVAVGGAGSGAASAAQRYFTALGLWDGIEVEFLGYSKAASAMGDRLVDAFWVLAGFPNASVIQAAASNPVRLLDLAGAAERSGFLASYPFYQPVEIPAGTYRGVEGEVFSFQDAALWVARQDLPPRQVAAALAEIFSKPGLAYMVKVKSTARSMSVASGLHGIVTPLHVGAESFWRAQGLQPEAEHLDR